MTAEDLQYRTMRTYKALVDHRKDWGGRLVLLAGPGAAEGAETAAISISGGAALVLDSDAAAMKAALRAGRLDFVVNTLDEALRALKNEVRQKRALSVGLIADVNTTLTEMVQRGVQPDLEIEFPSHAARHAAFTAAFETFVSRRAAAGPRQAETPRDLSEVWGNPHFFKAADASALRALDGVLLATLSPESLVRRRWVERVPRYVREARSGGRWIWLSKDELASLAAQGISPQPHS